MRILGDAMLVKVMIQMIVKMLEYALTYTLCHLHVSSMPLKHVNVCLPGRHTEKPNPQQSTLGNIVLFL